MNEIAELAHLSSLPLAQHVTDDAFKDLATSSKFLPRLQLYSSSSEACKTGKINVGRYGIAQGSQILDLGIEARGYVLGVRLKAMKLDANPIVSYFNPALKEFQAIKIEADSNPQSKSLAGPEFCLYLPGQKEFVTFYMCSKTMKREAPNVKALLGKAVTLKITLIKNARFTWHGPIVNECTIPLDLPDRDKMLVVLKTFNNPDEGQAETVTDEEAAAAGVARPR